MKGKKCLGPLLHSRVFSVFLLLLLSLLLSLFPTNKASAITYNLNLTYVDRLYTSGYNYYTGYQLGSYSSSTGVNFSRTELGQNADKNFYIAAISSQTSRAVVKDEYYLLRCYAYTENTESAIGVSFSTGYNNDFDIADVKINYSYDQPYIDDYVYSYPQSPGSSVLINGVGQHYIFPLQYTSYDILLRAASSGTKSISVGRSDGSSINQVVYVLPPVMSDYRFQFSCSNYIQHFKLDTSSEDMNEKDEQDRDNLENQKTESQDSSDDSQEDAENTGTTLLAAFSSFVTAITSVNPSNCNLLMNIGHLNLGNVDLCQLSPPVEFQAIGSIFLIFFCVPLSIATARKVISLFRSFQT